MCREIQSQHEGSEEFELRSSEKLEPVFWLYILHYTAVWPLEPLSICHIWCCDAALLADSC